MVSDARLAKETVCTLKRYLMQEYAWGMIDRY
jgi:hypothetical protein